MKSVKKQVMDLVKRQSADKVWLQSDEEFDSQVLTLVTRKVLVNVVSLTGSHIEEQAWEELQ